MNTTKFTWKGYEWQTQERWGDIHPDKPWAQYSPECVNINKRGELELSIGEPFIHWNENRTWSAVWDMGLVSSTENNPKFLYGRYDFVAKLPRGKHLWPALWMWSWECWPPEIDVMEAWTNDCGTYKYNKKLSHITNCVHWGYFDAHKPKLLKLKYTWYRVPWLFFNKYSVEWLPRSIKFYFNDKLVSCYEGENGMKWIDSHIAGGMNVIMNLYPTSNYKEGDMKTPLIIRDFKYTQIDPFKK